MGFFTKVDHDDLQLMSVAEGVETECLIPITESMKIDLFIRSPKPVSVFWIDADGDIKPLTFGNADVRWRGKLAAGSVQIVASSSFWYRCQQSRLFEFVDPTPMSVELVNTPNDVLRSMIDERIRAYKIKAELDRELTEDEKDELVLDIVNGDLDFDDEPDAFGLGYEERLAEFLAEQKEEEPPAEPAAAPASSVPGSAPTPPAAGSTSSPT